MSLCQFIMIYIYIYIHYIQKNAAVLDKLFLSIIELVRFACSCLYLHCKTSHWADIQIHVGTFRIFTE